MSSVVLNVTSGRGPIECRIAVAKVVAEIAREAKQAGLAVRVSPGDDRDGAGPLSAFVVIVGNGVESFCRSWLGSIQWTARSTPRGQRGRKNWYVGIRICAAADQDFALSPADVRFETMRAGGPGGQHQNRTESAVRAVHVPTGAAVVARGERSQHRNKAVAFDRLKDLLAARSAEAQSRQARRDWSRRVVVERGNAVRAYEGMEFTRVR
jgi:peptide chain release factor